MSEHFKNGRKRESNAISKHFPELYQSCWDESITCINFQDGIEYPSDDAKKTVAQIHDLMGADRLVLRETQQGSLPVFIEEKTRTFKREKLDTGFYDSPKDEDLALTISYHNKSNQPKYQKHVQHYGEGIFIPSYLAYLVYDPDGNIPIYSYLIDYKQLIECHDDIAKSLQHNEVDGNSTYYISQGELEQRGLVTHRWENTRWSQ